MHGAGDSAGILRRYEENEAGFAESSQCKESVQCVDVYH